MRRLRRFLCLTRADRRLLVTAALLLGAVRLALSILPFRTVRCLLTTMTASRAEGCVPEAWSPERVAWAVSVTGRYVLGARRCLAEALASRALLAREGQPATLMIGVARGRGGELEAHAWVESGDRVVVGASRDLSRYVPLLVLE